MSNLIKGYLPIQISLPSQTEKGSENTFIFVKQHTSSSESSSRFVSIQKTHAHILLGSCLWKLREIAGKRVDDVVTLVMQRMVAFVRHRQGAANIPILDVC